MKKFLELLRREKIPNVMGGVFVYVALITSCAVLFAPFQLPEGARAAFFTQSYALFDWMFILIPPVAISIVAGITMLIKLLLHQR